MYGIEYLAAYIFTFEKLIENGFTYEGKKDWLLPLVDMSISSQFFILARRLTSPRAGP